MEDKIQKGVEKIEKEELENRIPILYGSCSCITDESLNIIGETNHQLKKFTLRNTIIQNIFPGHAQIMNRALVNMLRKTDFTDKINMYDSWIMNVAILYGKIIFDNEPHTYYRQHSQNVIGFNKKIT